MLKTIDFDFENEHAPANAGAHGFDCRTAIAWAIAWAIDASRIEWSWCVGRVSFVLRCVVAAAADGLHPLPHDAPVVVLGHPFFAFLLLLPQ